MSVGLSAERPDRLLTSVDMVGDGLKVTRSKRNLVVGCFLSIWLAGWTAGCVMLTTMAITQREPFLFLFSVPFWAAWFFGVAILGGAVLSRETLTLDSNGLKLSKRASFWGKTSQIPLSDLRTILVPDADSVAPNTEPVMTCHGRNQVVEFGQGLPRPELAWLAAVLEETRIRLQQWAGTPLEEISNEPVPPAKTAWTSEIEYDDLVLVKRGRWEAGAIGGMLFVTLFWNGIVSVFVAVLLGLMPGEGAPDGATWWFLFLFLIPFELIGLALIAGLAATIAAPFRREVWKFGRSEITHRVTWFGIGRVKSFEPPRDGRIEAMPMTVSSDESPSLGSRTDDGSPLPASLAARFQVQVIDSRDVEVCTIASLTDLESRWIAHLLRRERPEYARE
jgi:hypothetical protein